MRMLSITLLFTLLACQGGAPDSGPDTNAPDTNAPGASAPEAVPEERLEFLHERLIDVQTDASGATLVGFERSSRWFKIDGRFVEDPAVLIAEAKKAKASGRAVHATVYDPDPQPKSPRPVRPGVSARLLRLGPGPDPRQR